LLAQYSPMNEKSKYNPNIHHRRSIRLKGYDYSQAGLYYITICCYNRICRFGQIENGEMILNDAGKIAYDEWIDLSIRFPNFELDVFQIMPNHMHAIILLTDIPAPVGAGFTPAQNNDMAQCIDMAPNDKGAPYNDMAPYDTGAPYNDIAQNNEIVPNNDMATDDNIAKNDDIAKNQIHFNSTHIITPTIFDIIGAYKSLVSNGCLDIYKSHNKFMGKLWQRNYYEHIIRDEKSYFNISNYIIKNPENWGNDKFNKK
jgi:putative transposase